MTADTPDATAQDIAGRPRVFTYRCNVCGKNKRHNQPPECSSVAFCGGCGWGSVVPRKILAAERDGGEPPHG